MNEIAVSVIVPVFNSERYICECINSLRSQILSSIEIIIIDDGSTDSTPQICDNFAKKDNRITVIHQKNKKQGSARNTGIKIAKGDYIAFVDSDDWVGPTFLFDMYQKAVEFDADVVMCDYYRVKSNSDFKKSKKSRIDKQLRNGGIYNFKKLKKQLSRHFGFGIAVCWNKLFKANLVKKYLYFPEDVYFEDSAPVFRTLAMADRITAINKKLYFYRTSNLLSTTHVNDIKHFDLFTVQNILIKDFEKFEFGKFQKFSINFMMKDLIKHFKSIDKSLKYKFYLEIKNILSVFKRKNYLKDIDWFYRIKASVALNHTYFLFKILSKI